MSKTFIVAQLISLLFLIGCAKETNQSQEAYLTSIEKDYLIIESNGKEQKLKLCGIDIPVTQITAVKKLIENLVKPADGLIVVSPMGMVNNTLAAEVYAPTGKSGEEKSLNGELLLKGLAKLSNPENCSNREAFASAQDDAKQQRIGIWK